MGTKHIHANEIKAWADGEDIEIYLQDSFSWCRCPYPSWDKENKYRVKPKNIVVARHLSYLPEHRVTETCVSHDPNIRCEFTPDGKLVSVEML